MSLAYDTLERERVFASSFHRAAVDGIHLDADRVHELIAEHERDQAAARQRVEDASDGRITNPKSNAQVPPYLAELGYKLPLSEKTGKPGAPAGALEPLAYGGDTLAADILEYREHDTALGLLLRPRRALCELGDGKVRTTILTLAANTGRTSSRNENLQQVSRQGGMRACHLAAPGCLIVSADMASVEIRTGAALSGDVNMQGLIKLGDEHPDKKKEFDFHWRTAISVWGPEATKENRYTAKRINFQKMYGGKAPGCAKAIGIPLNVASKVFDAFDALAPRYVAWDQEMRAAVSGGRESMTLYSGRDVYFGHKGEHAAGNTAIQGTAREFLVDGIMKWRQSKWKDCLAIPVHDEVIVFDVPEGEADEATACLVDCLHTWLNGVEIVAEANKPSPFWCDASLFADYARNSARLRLCQLRGIDARRVLTPTVSK